MGCVGTNHEVPISRADHAPPYAPRLSCLNPSLKSPRPLVSLSLDDCESRHELSHGVHSDRFLVYKPIISPKAQPGPTRPNTGGRTPSRQNVGKPADLLKMPIDVFYEVTHQEMLLYATDSCHVDCLVPPPIGDSPTRTRIFQASRRFNVEKLCPCLDRREADDWHAKMPSRYQRTAICFPRVRAYLLREWSCVT